MTDTGTLARMLDDSFAEFDRLMSKAIAEVAEHANLSRDFETLCARQQALRLAGAGFVCEAAMAFADQRLRNAAA